MDEVSTETLKRMADELESRIGSEITRDSLEFMDFHGFLIATIPDIYLCDMLPKYGLVSETGELDIATVDRDQTDKAHTHKNAHAYIRILGAKHGFEDPRNAYVYINDKWVPAVVGDSYDVPKNTAHGLSVIGSGIVTFLSIQFPRIGRSGDDDDFHFVKAPPIPK